MIKLNHRSLVVLLALFSLQFANLAQAGEVLGDPASTLQQALQLWPERTQMAKVDEMVNLLQGAKRSDGDKETQYQIHILLVRGLYWKGTQVSQKDQKMKFFLSALNTANEAKAISDDYAEAYYYAAIARGRWSELNGITSSLQYIGEVKGNCAKAMERITISGDAGESVEGYGPDRTLGRLNMKLPSFAGGSMEKAREHLERAFHQGTTFANNTVFYADFLSNGSSSDRAQARRILDELLAKDPASINPDRLPEMKAEYEEARALRRQIGLY